MKIVSVAKAKATLSACLKDSETGPVVVTRNGRPVTVMLAVGDEEELERLIMAYSPRLRKILDAARARVREGAGIAHEEFWEGVNRAAETKRKPVARRKSA